MNNRIEQMIDELSRTKDGQILSELNKISVHVVFLPEGIRWHIKKVK
jgi:hypothetical protein